MVGLAGSATVAPRTVKRGIRCACQCFESYADDIPNYKLDSLMGTLHSMMTDLMIVRHFGAGYHDSQDLTLQEVDQNLNIYFIPLRSVRAF